MILQYDATKIIHTVLKNLSMPIVLLNIENILPNSRDFWKIIFKFNERQIELANLNWNSLTSSFFSTPIEASVYKFYSEAVFSRFHDAIEVKIRQIIFILWVNLKSENNGGGADLDRKWRHFLIENVFGNILFQNGFLHCSWTVLGNISFSDHVLKRFVQLVKRSRMFQGTR